MTGRSPVSRATPVRQAEAQPDPSTGLNSSPSASPGFGPGPSACPCGSGAVLSACCGRYHAGPQHLQAPTAEALMRSRYSAFVLNLDRYLMDTWHRSTRPLSWDAPPTGLRWLGLQVRRHVQPDENHATVEFVARSKLGGRAQRLHETSRFLHEDGRWFYVDGDVAGSVRADAGAGLGRATGPGAASARCVNGLLGDPFGDLLSDGD